MSNYPIPEHPEWYIRDPSKMSDLATCYRKFFFKHLLGWVADVPRNDLTWGEAWHIGQEHILLNGYDDLNVVRAFDKFLECYRKKFSEDTDELFTPKTPLRALMAYQEYATKYQHDLDEFEVLFTEISGTVPVCKDPERILHFRMDNILKYKIGYGSMEHKSKGGSVTDGWFRQWPLSFQVGTYHHALYCLYPENEVVGMVISGAGILKTKFDFQRLPIKKGRDQMQVWLFNMNYWLEELEEELGHLSAAKESDPIFVAFPQVPTSCEKYWGCEFHDYCLAWANPLQHCEEPPLGFVQKFWDPRKKPFTHKMDLGGEYKED